MTMKRQRGAGASENVAVRPVRARQGRQRPGEVSEATKMPRDPQAMIWLTLPFPPSTNHLYATVDGRRVKTKAARDYAERCRDVLTAWFLETERIFPTPPLAVALFAWPPDRRRRDLDNLQKSVLDGIFEPLKSEGVNDSEVVVLNARKLLPSTEPKVVVTISHTEDRSEP